MSKNSTDIILDYATIRYDEPIIYLIFKEGAELGFPEIRELTSCAEKLSDKKPYFVFTDARSNPSVTQEGRRVAANHDEAPLNRGSAVLVNSNMLKLAINFFSGFKKPMYPFQAFTDEAKAIEWLLTLPLEN